MAIRINEDFMTLTCGDSVAATDRFSQHKDRNVSSLSDPIQRSRPTVKASMPRVFTRQTVFLRSCMPLL